MNVHLRLLAMSSLLLSACATTSAGTAQTGETFADFQKRLQVASLAIMNGDTRAWEEIYSHEPDATLFGGWGGPGEKGWDQLAARWKMVAGRYKHATLEIVPVTELVSGDLAYTVQLWRGEASFSDGNAGPIGLRVTHVYRRENGRWRIVHRHADEQMKLAPIKSHILAPDEPKPAQP